MTESDQTGNFRGRQPIRLAFGTSGLRGLVTDMTDLETYVNTRGFIEFLVERGEAAHLGRMAIAGDLRPSTDGPRRSILCGVVRAVTDSGFEPVYCDRIPTPAVLLYGLDERLGSIMVTGSHIPFDRNGIKFNKPAGEVLKSDETAILAAIERARSREYANAADRSIFDDSGMFRDGERPALPQPCTDAADRYLRRYLDFFPKDALAGTRIVVYQHSAVGRDILVEILGSLGAEVLPMDRTEEFVPIDTEAVSIRMIETLQRMADRAQASGGPPDAVVSTDGDSDRPLVAAIDPEGRVRFTSGDILGIVTATYLDADSIVVPVSATDAIERCFLPRGVRPVRTRIGSPWVIAEMAVQRGSRRVGWEANGGFIVGSDLETGGRRLPALPTRDAVLPIVAIAHESARTGMSPYRLLERLPQRHTRAGLLDDFPSEAGRRLMTSFAPGEPSILEAVFSGQGATATGVRGQDLAVLPTEEAHLVDLRKRLSRHFDHGRGFGRIARINFRDGIRMTFDNGDIAHIRPSGNAPQLRIYAIADSEARAEGIVAAGLAEPDGILRELERTLK